MIAEDAKELDLVNWSNAMKTTSLFLAAFLAWFVLNRWLFPWLGVPTCMSGGCGGQRCPACGLPPSLDDGQDAISVKGDQP
jgi:hypothetical protein